MSTKIYDAYIFNGGYDDIVPIMKKLKEVSLDRLKYDILKKFIMKEKVLSKYFHWMKEDKIISDLEWSDLSRFLTDVFGNRILLDIYNFKSPSCVVYMVNGRIAFQFFQMYDEAMKEISFDPRFVDYHYQNSTDQSNYDWDKEKWEEMTDERKAELEKDWEEREKFWDEVFGASDAPVDSGLVYEFIPFNFTMLCFELKNNKEIQREVKIDHIG